MVMTHDPRWRGVLVPPPNRLAAIGEALRHAYPVDGAARSLRGFGDLLGQLDGATEDRQPMPVTDG